MVELSAACREEVRWWLRVAYASHGSSCRYLGGRTAGYRVGV